MARSPAARWAVGFVSFYLGVGLITYFGFGSAQGGAVSNDFTGDVTITGSLDVGGNIVGGDLDVDSISRVGGDASITGTLDVDGNAAVGGSATVTGSATVGGHTIRDNGTVFELTSAASHSTTISSTAGSLVLKSQGVMGLQSTAGTYTIEVWTGTLRLGGSGGPVIARGTGTPEGNTTAPTGSMFLDTGGSLYFKESGSGNTGWVAK
jgi:hypothetical protein